MIESRQLPQDGNPLPIRILGFLEVLGIIGIIVPQLIGFRPMLTPIAAVCFSLVMVGAFFVHLNKAEYKMLPLVSLAFLLAVIVATYRFYKN